MPKQPKTEKPAPAVKSVDPLTELPVHSQVTLTQVSPGAWEGHLSLPGQAYTIVADGKHPAGVLAQLANQFVKAKDPALTAAGEKS